MPSSAAAGAKFGRSKETMMKYWTNSQVGTFLKKLREMPRAIVCWFVVGLMVFVGIGSYVNMSTLTATTIARSKLRNSVDAVHETLSILLDAETGQRGYLLTGDESYLEPCQSASKFVDAKMDAVESLATVMPDQAAKVETLRRLVALKVVELKTSVDLMRKEGREAALKVVLTDDGKRAMDKIRGLVAEIRNAINERLLEYDGQMTSLSRRSIMWGILGNVSAATLFTMMFFDRRRELRRRTRLEELATGLTRSADAMQMQIVSQSEAEIEPLGQQPHESAEFVPALQGHTLTESNEEIKALGQQARDLATFVETSRIQTLMQSDRKIAAMGQQARELARSVETSRIQTLNQSVNTIKALGQQARELATSVETSRIETLVQSDKEIEALGQQARELATSVETSRIETLVQSDKEIEALGQQARDLATSVETSRIQTLKQSDKEIEALGRLARDLARSVETSRIQTLMQSDKEIETLAQQARDLATSVEVLRLQTLDQSDKEIEALGQQARDLATSVEKARIQTLNKSNQEIRKLNEDLEQRVVERTAQLNAANKELESFSYSISHDLRAPLRAIDGFSRILLAEFAAPLADEGKAYLQRVRDNTRHMGHLVDDLLAFSHLGRRAIGKHSVEPGAIVRTCLAEMFKEQEGRQVEIVIGDLPSCQADPALLKQVWTNLLSNALKYTRKQQAARIEIGFRTEPSPPVNGNGNGFAGTNGSAPHGTGPKVIYFVKDNGAGFDMKYAHKLFGVFQRLHRSDDFDGTGVGLAIVQRIVERHGGRIWAEARLNQGATFSFTLD
jgi:signal transduction histidine kinase/CHASE3 domain sensor protein